MRRAARTSPLWPILLDAILAAACYVAAARFWLDVAAWVYLLYEGRALSIALAAASIVAAGRYDNWYTRGRLRSRISLVFSGISVVGVAFLVQALVHYFDPDWALPMPI